MIAPAAGHAITFGLGVGGGGTFPLSKYIQAAPNSSSYSLSSVKNGPGWSLHAELLLIGMEIRYTWQVFTWKEIKDKAGNNISTSGMPWLQFHSITLGYRWYLVKKAFKLYLPIGGGATFVTFNDVKKLKGQYGGTLYAGLEMEYEVVKHFTIGLGARYNFYITNQPSDIVKGKIADRLEEKYKNIDPTNPPTDFSVSNVKVKDVIATFHSITANLTLTLSF